MPEAKSWFPDEEDSSLLWSLQLAAKSSLSVSCFFVGNNSAEDFFSPSVWSLLDVLEVGVADNWFTKEAPPPPKARFDFLKLSALAACPEQ